MEEFLQEVWEQFLTRVFILGFADIRGNLRDPPCY